MNNKLIFALIVGFAIIIGVVYYFMPTVPAGDSDRLMDPRPGSEEVDVTDAEGVTFSGTLEEVNIGCFADGECYVVVDGKHVTAIMGWSMATVGTIQGVDGFGDLETHIGEEVEVYAQAMDDGTYSLYGNEEFYIKLGE